MLQAAGYVDLDQLFHGGGTQSYVFDGQWGTLDYALASATLLSQVVGAASYAINADEPAVLDYNTDFKSSNHVSLLYAGDEFRTSDHDPLLVGLKLNHTRVQAASGAFSWQTPSPPTATSGTALTHDECATQRGSGERCSAWDGSGTIVFQLAASPGTADTHPGPQSFSLVSRVSGASRAAPGSVPPCFAAIHPELIAPPCRETLTRFYELSRGFYEPSRGFYEVSCSFYGLSCSFYGPSCSFYEASCGFYELSCSFYEPSCSFYEPSCTFYETSCTFCQPCCQADERRRQTPQPAPQTHAAITQFAEPCCGRSKARTRFVGPTAHKNEEVSRISSR